MAARKRTTTGTSPAVAGPRKASAPKDQAAAKAIGRTPAGKPEVRIFVSYSHFDAAARTKLETHLASLLRDGVRTWFDGNIDPGDELDASISRALKNAHVLVALLSPEYISSRYCQMEYERAMARRVKGNHAGRRRCGTAMRLEGNEGRRVQASPRRRALGPRME